MQEKAGAAQQDHEKALHGVSHPAALLSHTPAGLPGQLSTAERARCPCEADVKYLTAKNQYAERLKERTEKSLLRASKTLGPNSIYF